MGVRALGCRDLFYKPLPPGAPVHSSVGKGGQESGCWGFLYDALSNEGKGGGPEGCDPCDLSAVSTD